VSNAVIDAATFALRLSHISSGAVEGGFGTGIEFELEENDGTNRVAAYISADWQDAGEGASADGRLNFGVMTGDAAAATAMSIWNGKVGIGTAAPGAKLDISQGDILLDNGRSVLGKYNLVGYNLISVNGSAYVDVGSTSLTGVLLRGNVGIGIAAPLAKLHVDQASTSGAVPVLSLDQADISDGFINFIGASAASAAGPISTWTTGNSIQGFVRVEINGAQVWMPYYDAPTS